MLREGSRKRHCIYIFGHLGPGIKHWYATKGREEVRPFVIWLEDWRGQSPGSAPLRGGADDLRRSYERVAPAELLEEPEVEPEAPDVAPLPPEPEPLPNVPLMAFQSLRSVLRSAPAALRFPAALFTCERACKRVDLAEAGSVVLLTPPIVVRAAWAEVCAWETLDSKSEKVCCALVVSTPLADSAEMMAWTLGSAAVALVTIDNSLFAAAVSLVIAAWISWAGLQTGGRGEAELDAPLAPEEDEPEEDEPEEDEPDAAPDAAPDADAAAGLQWAALGDACAAAWDLVFEAANAGPAAKAPALTAPATIAPMNFPRI